MHCPGCGVPASPPEDGDSYSHVLACGYIGEWDDEPHHEPAEWLTHAILEKAASKPTTDPTTGEPHPPQRRSVENAEKIITKSLRGLTKLPGFSCPGIEDYAGALHEFQSDVLKNGEVSQKSLDKWHRVFSS